MLLKYSLRHILASRSKSLVAALSVAAVVSVFVVVLSLAAGLKSVFDHTGDQLDLMVMHKGSLGDMNGGVDTEVLKAIRELPGIRKDSDGNLLVSPEQYVIAYLTRRGSDQGANITVRGLSPVGFALRSRMRLLEGRRLRPGAHEIMVSQFVSRRYQNMSLGDRFHLGQRDWTVVGIFDGGESIINTEVWADLDELSAEYGRTNFYSLILARAVDMNALRDQINRMTSNPKISVRAVSQNEYARDRGRISRVLSLVAIILSVTLSIGAAFVMLSVMDAGLVSRARELAMLRVIGFRRGRIFLSFLGESVMLALIGGLLGCVVPLLLNKMAVGAPFMIYREIGFRAQVSPGLILAGLILAAAIGLVGGLLPAYRAGRQDGVGRYV
ncbi:MAG TPA: FtsX-like permease family protein [Pyrinomonadaceae bacterium]|jgi:ABC-type antimicrobial peptide transport system permease subunit